MAKIEITEKEAKSAAIVLGRIHQENALNRKIRSAMRFMNSEE